MSPESIDDPRHETLLFCEGLIGRIVTECHQRREHIESLSLDEALSQYKTQCKWELSVPEQSLLFFTPGWWDYFEGRLQTENIGVETDGFRNLVLTFRFERTMRHTEVREGVLKVIDPSFVPPKKEDRKILWK